MNPIAYFEIQAEHPVQIAEFYAAIFGWTFTLEPQLPIEYYRIQTPGMAGGLLKRPAGQPRPEMGTNAFNCSMQVDNFDETAARILSLGGQVAMEKFPIPGRCWQGYFLDPDHNVFGLFEVDEQAGM